MRLSPSGARQRKGAVQRLSGGEVPDEGPSPSQVTLQSSGSHSYSAIKLGDCVRLSLMLTPVGRGSFDEQAQELLRTLRRVLDEQQPPALVITQTVFLRDASDRAGFEQLFSDFYRGVLPVTNYVLQPPCCGAALALEALAITGASARVQRFGPHASAVTFDGIRWVYCASG